MEKTEAIFGKHRAFTASDANRVIVGAKANYLEGVVVTMNYLQNTTTAPTIAAALGLVNPLTLDVGGTNEINARMVDIYALNVLWMANNTITKLTAGDNQEGIVGGIFAPCWWPPTNEETKISSTYNAVTNADTTELSLTAYYLEGHPRRQALHYTEFTRNTSGVDNTSLNNWDEIIDAIGDLLGVLMFNTTVAGGAVLIEDGTIQQVAVDVNGTEKSNWEWHEINAVPNIFHGQSYVSLRDSPADLSILDNYRWLPMSKEPPVAGDEVKLRVMAGVDAEAIRTLAVQGIRY